jgi:succinate-semialdehyde dehydrogenase/glutarate-semialdehyde dehydrogenase
MPLDGAKLLHTDLYIDGAWQPATGHKRFPVENPATGEIIAEVADATLEDAAHALDAAEAAFPLWAGLAPRQRSEILRRAFELMTDEAEAFARLITRENGKALPDSRAEVGYAAEFFRWNAEEAVRNIGEISKAPASGARILVNYKPAGIAVLVTPWNYPAAMGTRKIAPALAAGCPVIVKPAAETPLTLLGLMSVLEAAGVPKGVVNVLPTRNPGPMVDALLHDPRVRVVSFTGSTQVGRKLLRSAADAVVNPAMELGGNAPLVVFDDADFGLAIEGTLAAKMRNMGSACTAANRIYVHERIHDAFAGELAVRMAGLRVGNGLEDGVDVGALVNRATLDKVASFVADAVARGARPLTGGRPIEGRGYFYPPTVLVDVPNGALCLRDEIFGPVAVIQKFDDQTDIAGLCNDTEYGLAAYVFTRDLKRGLAFAERLDFGMVGLNRGLLSDPAAPFGGMKQSGLGREGAHEGLMEFLETQYISVEW